MIIQHICHLLKSGSKYTNLIILKGPFHQGGEQKQIQNVLWYVRGDGDNL
jgi:hypothetical protein